MPMRRPILILAAPLLLGGCVLGGLRHFDGQGRPIDCALFGPRLTLYEPEDHHRSGFRVYTEASGGPLATGSQLPGFAAQGEVGCQLRVSTNEEQASWWWLGMGAQWSYLKASREGREGLELGGPGLILRLGKSQVTGTSCTPVVSVRSLGVGATYFDEDHLGFVVELRLVDLDPYR